MESTVVLVVRHTDVHNPNNLFYGRLPRFKLSALGQEQAERTAAYLAGTPITAIYSSPQLRARQTARVIARRHHDAPVRVSTLLSEVLTSWQGTPFSALGANVNVYEPLRSPTDETIARIFHRMNKMLTRVARDTPRQTAVDHADPIMILRVGVAGLDLKLGNLRGAEYPVKARSPGSSSYPERRGLG